MIRSHIVIQLFITFFALCGATDNFCPRYGYHRVANPRSKTSFYICKDGYADLKYCPNGYYFDSQSADCITASSYSDDNRLDHDNRGSYRNTRSNFANQQSNGYRPNQQRSQQQQQNSPNYQQNGYGQRYNQNVNGPQRQQSRNYQQDDYGNNQQYSGNNQINNNYRSNGQQQNSRYRTAESQTRNAQRESNSRGSDLETDPEANRHIQDRLRASSSNTIPRVICPRVIKGNVVLMPNDEDQSTYYVCQKSGAKRLVRCPDGTKFNTGLKACLSSNVNTGSSSSSGTSRKYVDQHW